MADKKLNAVSTASDGAYVYAEDANGNQIKISKADLASVVAGLMNSDKLYPFNRYGFITDKDANTLSDGFYLVNAGSNSTTLHFPISYGMLLSFSSNGVYKIQIFTNADPSNPSFVIRFCYNNVWSGWRYLNS